MKTFTHRIQLAVLIVLALLPVSMRAYDFSISANGRTFYFNITSTDVNNKTCEITYCNKEVIDGETIYNTKYGEFPFMLGIPRFVEFQGDKYEVTGIGDHAFQNTGIRYHIVESYIKYIGKEAYKDCKSLFYVILSNVESVGERAFENSSLMYALLDGNRTNKIRLQISSAAFHNCCNLEIVSCREKTPANFDVAMDAFDIVDGKISHKLNISSGSDFRSQFEQEVPWKYFDVVENESFELTTSLPQPKVENAPSCIYDLQGRPISHPKKREVYVEKGRKVVVQ